jgi:hypothetical protein
MRDEFKIGDDANSEAAFDRFPNTLAAFDLEHWIDFQFLFLQGCLEGTARRGSALAQDKRLIDEFPHFHGFPLEPRMIAVHENNHAMRAVRNHLDPRVFGDVREDRDFRIEVENTLQRALRISEQRRNLDIRVIALESGENFRGMKWSDRRHTQISLLEFAVCREKIVR